jgi:hypothetical protein
VALWLLLLEGDFVSPSLVSSLVVVVSALLFLFALLCARNRFL